MILACAALAAACSSSSDGESSAELDNVGGDPGSGGHSGGGTAGDAGRSSSGATGVGGGAPGGCLEENSSDELPGDTRYSRHFWDPVDRMLVGEYSTTPDFATVSTLKWRYASEGRIIAYLGVEQPFQHDYAYDERDNVEEFRLTYPETPDLMHPSTADVWIGRTYANVYDAEGRLTESRVTEHGGGITATTVTRTFEEDSEGRCARILTTGASTGEELLEYDASGRLSRVVATSSEAGCEKWIHTLTYDDQGRVLVSATACEGNPHPYFGNGRSSEAHTYLPDGSETVAIHDELTDVTSDRNRTLKRSVACLRIDVEIGKPRDARCRSFEFWR